MKCASSHDKGMFTCCAFGVTMHCKTGIRCDTETFVSDTKVCAALVADQVGESAVSEVIAVVHVPCLRDKRANCD